MTTSSFGGSPLSRRTVLAGSIAGIGATIVLASPAAAAPNYSVIPRLLGEISRTDTVLSRVGRTPYEVIDVSIGGDRTRLFVPHTAAPSLTSAKTFLWYYHANGSSYAALSGAFQYAADQAVDRGFVCICPNYGGSEWTGPKAIAAHGNAVKWVTAQWKVGASFLRSNSGGGTLLSWAYGNRLVPSIRGAYIASGTFDMADIAERDPLRVLPAYGNDLSTVPATNPALLPQSVWAGTRLRISGSDDDIIVPFAKHGLALHEKALPVAKETSILRHSGEGAPYGHVVPSATNKDMLDIFDRWLAEGPVDETPNPPQPTAPGAGTYQNGSESIVTEGTWSTLSASADNGGSISYSTSTGASASLTFTGTAVSWVSRRTSSSGINEVYIDGALVASVDRYSSSTAYARTVWTSGPLAAGTHTITIKRGSTRNPSSSGSNIILDAFVVENTPVTTPPTPTAAGPGTYQNGDALIVTEGIWSSLSSSADNGGSISYSTSVGASAALTFSGTKVSWVSRRTSSSGTNEVYLDGVLVTTVDRYSASTKYNQTVWTSDALPAGTHTITIKRGSTRNAASSGSNLILDAIVVS
ncbi:hypothetical protein [Rathayibacter sp. Leaf296]|uniref:hypothetical protein n=1 Tax=Rathayibacter sp. Leaf296 TaxID=1736327 RepID=UPI0007036A36|nr:hypothetical protein [Rathayibacter sp. Leaf296]KQQ11123.1 hypothetical protein ASF46_09230 [Rathayibacter sp. Leaf296]